MLYLAVSELPVGADRCCLHLAVVSSLDQLPVRALLVPVQKRGASGSSRIKMAPAVSLLLVNGGVSALPIVKEQQQCS